MFTEIFLSVMLAALMTFIGAWWIAGLYRTSNDLTFPDEILSRSRYRRPILFCTLTALNFYVLSTMTAPEKFFMLAANFFLMLMILTDFEQYMLFDAMTIPFAIIGAIRVWQLSLNVHDHALAAIIGGGIFLLLAIISSGSLGGGDVKLIAALGLWLGCMKLLNVVLIGTVSGGLAAVLMILTKKKSRGSYFAYGPYFALSALYALLT